jgi:hypothetical protein
MQLHQTFDAVKNRSSCIILPLIQSRGGDTAPSIFRRAQINIAASRTRAEGAALEDRGSPRFSREQATVGERVYVVGKEERRCHQRIASISDFHSRTRARARAAGAIGRKRKRSPAPFNFIGSRCVAVSTHVAYRLVLRRLSLDAPA